MTKKIFGITVLSIVLYTVILACVGLFGDTIQNYSIHYSLVALKYGLVLFGFAVALFLPWRIHKALIQRAEEKYQRESTAKIIAAAQKEKETQESIINVYKQEDAV